MDQQQESANASQSFGYGAALSSEQDSGTPVQNGDAPQTTAEVAVVETQEQENETKTDKSIVQGPRPPRMNPGDWACSECGNINFAFRDACNKCQVPKPPDAVGLGENTREQNKSDWGCNQCGFGNHWYRTACHKCQAEKPPVPTLIPGTGPHAYKGFGGFGMGGKGGKGGKGGMMLMGGDWPCDQCGNINFAHRTVCNRCGIDKPLHFHSSHFDMGMGMGGPGKGKGFRAGRPRPPNMSADDWMCPEPQCANINWAQRTECNMCNAPRPGGGGVKRPKDESDTTKNEEGGEGEPATKKPFGTVRPPRLNPGDWPCSECGNINFAFRTKCNRCENVKPEGAATVVPFMQSGGKGKGMGAKGFGKGTGPGRPGWRDLGDWPCPQCGNINFKFRTECNKCYLPRPDDGQQGQQGQFGGGKGKGFQQGGLPPWSNSMANEGGDWSCGQCGNHNYAFRQVCNKCAAPRAAAAIDYQAAYAQQAAAQTAAYQPPAWPVDQQALAMGAQVPDMQLQHAEQHQQHQQYQHQEALLHQQNQMQGHVQVGQLNSMMQPSVTGAVPGQEDWPCMHCGNLNFGFRTECNMCKQPKHSLASMYGAIAPMAHN